MLLLQDILGFGRRFSIAAAVLLSAFLFSVHHHIFFVNGQLGTGEAFGLSKFLFRMLAGVYFAVLYALRGFGIAAGTHAFYDILAAMLNLLVFS
jgi:membrane protease YdiL (CAAX protease family)